MGGDLSLTNFLYNEVFTCNDEILLSRNFTVVVVFSVLKTDSVYKYIEK